MFLVLIFCMQFFTVTLTAAVYRKPLTKSLLTIQEEKKTSFWISSIHSLQEQLIAPQALPAVVCITHSSFPQTSHLCSLLETVQKTLLSKVQLLGVDIQNQQLVPFVLQVKQQLGLLHMPLPAFIFFKKSAIVLPVQAGINTAEELTKLACKRFNISLTK